MKIWEQTGPEPVEQEKDNLQLILMMELTLLMTYLEKLNLITKFLKNSLNKLKLLHHLELKLNTMPLILMDMNFYLNQKLDL